MMHLKITDEIRERCLREAAHEAHINDRIVTSTPQTLAERGMTMLGSTRATPRIRSYLYCDAVDACFLLRRGGAQRRRDRPLDG